MYDLGWHLVDTVMNLLGECDRPSIEQSEALFTRPSQDYDTEDTCLISLSLPIRLRSTVPCRLKVSRAGYSKVDKITMTGSDGILVADDKSVTLYLSLASGKRCFVKTGTGTEEAFDQMFRCFYEEVQKPQLSTELTRYSELDCQVMSIIQSAEDHRGYNRSLKCNISYGNSWSLQGSESSAHPFLGQTFHWPQITPDIRADVLKQLDTTISIYGNDGVFAEFESEFKEMLGKPEWYSLLHNSGSNALSALFYACGLLPGDEVLFPVYGFHATTSPAMHFGIRPIFVEVTDLANISATALEKCLSTHSKAVMITHMWGIPCDMPAILEVLQKYPHVLLLEDCSHAHGARIGGQVVGTFGDGAVWSLQGQKVISGGEGGILVTKHADFHMKGLIWGHYNKRCKLEIPKDHALAPYATTGAGLKHRAHPLAVSIALNQLRKLSDFQKFKSMHAAELLGVLGDFPFLELPNLQAENLPQLDPAWYNLWVKFKKQLAPPGLTRESFVQDLKSSGLVDVGIPHSTGLLHTEPLFARPHEALPHIYPAELPAQYTHLQSYPVAQAMFDEMIKFPVWATREQAQMAQLYIRCLRQIARRYH